MSFLPKCLRLSRPSMIQVLRGVHSYTPSEIPGVPLVECDLYHENKIGVLTLNDPAKLNALTESMGEALLEKVEYLKTQNDLRAIILTGKGKAFSAGGDLNWLLARHKDTYENNQATMLAFYARLLSIRSLEVPIIGALRGPAIGAGACLAIAGCDLRIAEKSTKIAFNFLKIGLHPGMGGTHFLPDLVGPAVAAELLLTGRTIDANEALQLGIISKICSNAIVDAFGLATEILDCGPEAIKTCLMTLRKRQETSNLGLQAALVRESEAQAQTYATSDLREGVLAIQQKRKPVFIGK